MRIFRHFAILLLFVDNSWIPSKLIFLIRMIFLQLLTIMEKLCLLCIRYLGAISKNISPEIENFQLRLEFIDELRFMLQPIQPKWRGLLNRPFRLNKDHSDQRKVQLFLKLIDTGQTDLAERFLVSVLEENKTDSYNLLRLHNYLVENGRLEHSIAMMVDDVSVHEKGRIRDLVEGIILYYLGRLWCVIDEYTDVAGACGQNSLKQYCSKVMESNGVNDLTIISEQKLSILLEDNSFTPSSPLDKSALYCLMRILRYRDTQKFFDIIQRLNIRMVSDARVQFELGKYYQVMGKIDDAKYCFSKAHSCSDLSIPDAHFQSAVISLEEGNKEDAAVHFYESLKDHSKGVKNAIVGG